MVSTGYPDIQIPACGRHVKEIISVNQEIGKSGWTIPANGDIRKTSMQIQKLTMQN
jgi:hypothetical protein